MLWGGWGERKKERAGLSIFSIIDILMGIPSGSLCGGEKCSHGGAIPHPNGFVEILANLQ